MLCTLNRELRPGTVKVTFSLYFLLNHHIGSAPANLEGSARSFVKGQSRECSLAQGNFPTLGLPTMLLRRLSVLYFAKSHVFSKYGRLCCYLPTCVRISLHRFITFCLPRLASEDKIPREPIKIFLVKSNSLPTQGLPICCSFFLNVYSQFFSLLLSTGALVISLNMIALEMQSPVIL